MIKMLARLNILYFLPIIFVIFFLLVFSFMSAGVSSLDASHPLISKNSAPPLYTVPLGDDQDNFPPIKGDVLRQEGIKIVNFWASWCYPCRLEHPQLMTLQTEGVKIYGVSYVDRPKNARTYLEKYGNPYVGAGDDPGRKTALEWAVRGVPESYIIDGRGRVVFNFSGPITEDILAKIIRPALEKARTIR